MIHAARIFPCITGNKTAGWSFQGEPFGLPDFCTGRSALWAHSDISLFLRQDCKFLQWFDNFQSIFDELCLFHHSVHWGITPPPPLSCQAPLKSTNCPSSSPFLVNLPLYIGFSWTLPPPKSRIFQWNHKILKFCILSTILYFNGKAGIKIVQKKFNPLMHNVPKWSDTL